MASVGCWATKNHTSYSYGKCRTWDTHPPLPRRTLAGRETGHKWHMGQHFRRDTGHYQNKYQPRMRQNEPTRPPDLSRGNYYHPQTWCEPSGSIREKDARTLQEGRVRIPDRLGKQVSSSREGLDVSRFAFGAILRDFIRTPASAEAMGSVLDRFLVYDSGNSKPIVSLVLLSCACPGHSYSSFLCRVKSPAAIWALAQQRLSSTSSFASFAISHQRSLKDRAQLRGTRHCILDSFTSYFTMGFRMQSM